MRRHHFIGTVMATLALSTVAIATNAQAQSKAVEGPPDNGHPTDVSAAKTGLGQVYVDSHGMTLYAMDSMTALFRVVSFNGLKYCTGPCTQTWIALKAPANAKPVGAWKVVDGGDGPQWAYNGDPVFTYAGDKEPGATNGSNRDYLWRPLTYIPPVPQIKAPAPVTPVFVDQGYILQDGRGHALFTAGKSGQCGTDCANWQRLLAGMTSQNIGEWTVSHDGDRPQWAFRGELVYVSREGAPDQAPSGGTILAVDDTAAKAGKAAPPVPTASAEMPATPKSGEMGFVVSTFVAATVPGMKEPCPNGLSNNVRANFLTTVTPAERARLSKHENEPELTTRWKAYGFSPDQRMNICTNYDQFNHPLYKTVQSKIAYGLNLDGDTDGKPNDPYVCPHENFVSPTGDKGIDNQTYRALGCEGNWRGADGLGADAKIGSKSSLISDYTIVLLLRNVRSLVNDDNVEVVLASSQDKSIVDAQQNFVRDASYQVTKNPRWRAVLRGRIVNGILTTEPHDVVLSRPIGLEGNTGLRSEFNFARARLQFAFKPDGTLEGIMGGYEPLTAHLLQQIFGGAGTVTVADIDCAAAYRTLKTLADGERDPKTGQCNRISSAMQIEAVPAYVFDEASAAKTAEAK